MSSSENPLPRTDGPRQDPRPQSADGAAPARPTAHGDASGAGEAAAEGRPAAEGGTAQAQASEAAPRPVLTEKQAKRATSSAMAMLLSSLFLLAVVAAFLLLAPPPPVPERSDRVDVAEAAEQVRSAEDVPAVAPEVPEGWTSNFARWTTKDGISSWHVGWVVSEDVFAGLEQAADANPTWTAMRVKQAPAGDPVEAGGVSWTPHDPDGKDLFWVGEVDGSTVVLTTTGEESVIRELAEAVAAESR